MAGLKRRIHTDSDLHTLHKELEEVSCPICMEHPHNAVLLLCSSHDKGCRSYICDTSYRHSNCLDRFKRLQDNTRINLPLSSSLPSNSLVSNNSPPTDLSLTSLTENSENQNISERNIVSPVRLSEVAGRNGDQGFSRYLDAQGEGFLETFDSGSLLGTAQGEDLDAGNSSELELNLKCPMCRAPILGWEVVEEARKYLNVKKRSCSQETCSFFGNYQELRRHARRVHPTIRPSDVDPSRDRAWRRMERQREVGDIVSAIRSTMPGAVFVGDYYFENGDRSGGDREASVENGDGSWLTTLFLFQMIGSMDRAGEPRPRSSRTWTRHRRPPVSLPERRFVWGENLLGLQDEEDDDLRILRAVDEDPSLSRRRRRRITLPRSDEDHP